MHRNTHFYNPSLHPLAELHEQSFHSFTPNGSLLEWIDGFFGNPESDLDRMIGKYSNITQALHIIPPGIYPRIHIKAFGYNDGMGCGAAKNIPYKHGQFNDDSVPYWNPELWKGGVPCPPVPAAGKSVSHPSWFTSAGK